MHTANTGRIFHLDPVQLNFVQLYTIDGFPQHCTLQSIPLDPFLITTLASDVPETKKNQQKLFLVNAPFEFTWV